MSQYSSYYLYQRYEKRGSQDWIPCYPNTYSISGDSSIQMPLVEKSSADTECGYVPEPSSYEWVVDEGYMCATCTPTKAMLHTSDSTYIISGSGELTRSDVSGYTSSGITDIVVTSDATSIGNGAFSGFTSVEFARIPNTVLSIGDWAFYGCSAMTDCQIPLGTISVGEHAFLSCVSLMYIDIPNSVTSLGESCFDGCLNFRYVSLPSSLSVIPRSCFNNCDGLSDIEIPSSITEIGSDAFAYCSGLYTVTCLATTPPTLGHGAFYGVNSNLKIYVPSQSVETYKSASGWSAYANKIYPIE